MTAVQVTRLRPDARLPAQAYAGDAGLDLTACERVELAPGARAVVGTGIAVAIPPGHAGLVVPRSGLAARHGLGKVNAPGLIDEGYRGEVKVILINTDRREPFVVEPGMRIAQLVIVELPRVELVEVDVRRMGDVDLEFAIGEGEGFTSVADWYEAHVGFFTSEEMTAALGEPPVEIGEDTPVVCSRFRVVERM